MTPTRTAVLTDRWPTAVGLLGFGVSIALIVLLDADSEFAPGVATMAGIYLVAYALGRPAAAWLAFPALAVVVVLLILVDIDAGIGMTAVLVPLWIWAVLRGRARDGRWFTIETVGMVAFGAITVAAVSVDPKVGGVLSGIGFFAHGVWDVYHYRANKVVNRPWSEMCAVLDLPVGIALVVATLVR